MKEMPEKSIGERLRILRMSEGLTQNDAAKLLILSSGGRVSSYETGARQVPLDVLVRYSGIFDVSTDWILKGKYCTDCMNTA